MVRDPLAHLWPLAPTSQLARRLLRAIVARSPNSAIDGGEGGWSIAFDEPQALGRQKAL
jgi:hypothetical protein